MSGVFSAEEIREALDTGQIIIDPLVPENIRGSSVDLRLGEWFYSLESPEVYDHYNPLDPESVKRYFKGPFRAEPNAEWCARHGRIPWVNIPEEHPIIVLRPHERILAHTVEYAGIVYGGTTTMQARSTWGRNGIVVCKDAGWGDPGYYSRWTMEIQNDNHVLVPLPVGTRICQLVYYHMTGTAGSYGETGKYQEGTDLEALKAAWTPDAMLPRAYKDEIRPV